MVSLGLGVERFVFVSAVLHGVPVTNRAGPVGSGGQGTLAGLC